MERYESPLEQQIREAQERGEFDDLPGAGKPLPGAGEHYDENWWLKQWIHREGLASVMIPPHLRRRAGEADPADEADATEPQAHQPPSANPGAAGHQDPTPRPGD